ncbi:MAG: sensor histidine kinase [Candidatus Marinarcus sp.]|uniref:sensor histidine kinase n=1 Tax=Candidatus Marinarcus sp. TaxID=3100987 RepID=UPI003B001AA8
MLLNQLSISYKCHSSIGNSLKLHEMMDEVLKTFLHETDAIYGSFYRLDNQITHVLSLGKRFSYELNDLLKEVKYESIYVKKQSECLNLLVYRLENGLIILLYDNKIELDFIVSMYESFRQKLNISINSCLNVKKLEEKNEELEELALSLKKEVKKAVDISKERERQFFEQLKMAQMGELIGNIAHQWRQPLSVISTAASGMKLKKEMDILEDEDFYHYSDSILDNVMFLSNTIDEFRDYTKESHQEKDVVIQDRIKMAFKMVESSFKIENIKIYEDVIEQEPIVFKLILGELLQVIIPILNNARDALAAKKESNKWVKYSVYKNEFSVVITIEDNAGGIPNDILDKIFNPYFTTKHQTQGTGIGLYTCYDIVANHLGGALYAKNTHYGARFYIELPLGLNYII